MLPPWAEPRPMRALLWAFAAFALLQMGSGAALFFVKAGLAPSEVVRFYGPRSAGGLLSVMVPHLLALPLWTLTVAHLTVALRPAATLPAFLAPATAAAALVTIAASPLVRLHSAFAPLKIAALLALAALAAVWLALFVARLRAGPAEDAG